MKNYRGKTKAQKILADMRAEIELKGWELLRLEFAQPGARVMCTGGALWLTQTNDSRDYILKTGQSILICQPGIVLAQGLPSGKVLLLEIVEEPTYNRNDCSSQWQNPIRADEFL